MIDVQLDVARFIAALKATDERVRVAARQTLGQGAAYAVARAKATTKFKDRTGALRASITRGQKSTFHHFIRAGAPHAVFVEYGTRPHAIEPRRARVLRFVQAGQVRFAKRVWHPGTKPTHFMDDAATEGARFLDWRMEEHIARALRGE